MDLDELNSGYIFLEDLGAIRTLIFLIPRL